MAQLSTLFPDSYEESRARFRQNLHRVQDLWPSARLAAHPVDGDENLTIDWIEADALEEKEKLLALTTGEHGIEGYVGSAMLQLFFDEILPRLEPSSTGLLLVHAINPWGMKHRRRTNTANVDLNRNFVWEARALDQSSNPDYAKLEPFLNPRGSIHSLWLSNLSFTCGLLWRLLRSGVQSIRGATLLGQYRFPQGIYYGGTSIQEETMVLMELYRQHLREYQHVVLLDMHTGYGPRYQMSLVNSCLEPRKSEELRQQFSYPLVVKSDPAEFYAMQGDMIDYLYTLVRQEFPHKRLYATSFEFGTLGDSLWATVRSLRAMVLENQMHWFGATTQEVRERIERGFAELFFPSEERWRAKVVADARQALRGILGAEGFLS